MTDYAKWDRFDHPDAHEPPARERGGALARDMVDDPKARKHYMTIMKDMAKKDTAESVRFEKARTEEEKRVAERRKEKEAKARRAAEQKKKDDAERQAMYSKVEEKLLKMQEEHAQHSPAHKKAAAPTPVPASWEEHLAGLPGDRRVTPRRTEMFWAFLALTLAVAPASRLPPPMWILLGMLFTGCVSVWLTGLKSAKHLSCVTTHAGPFCAQLRPADNFFLSVYLISLAVSFHALTFGVANFATPLMLAFNANRIVSVVCDRLTALRADAAAAGTLPTPSHSHTHGSREGAHGHAHSHAHAAHDILD